MRYVALLMALCLVSACATSVPEARNFPLSTQKKAIMAQHWSLIAEDAARRTRQSVLKQGFTSETPFYIADAPSNHAFDKAFKKYLISHLIAQGAVVSTQREGALEVKYESQLIRHSEGVDLILNGYQPGMLTAGVASFWILRDIFSSSSHSNRYAGLAASAAADGYFATNPKETPIELILTTSIVHQERYLMLNADSYYIEKGEGWLFEGCTSRRACR